MSTSEIITDASDDRYPDAMKRLTRAWKCITLPVAGTFTYLDLSQRNSMDNGEGINVFRFLRPKDSEKGNCEYYYANKGCTLWTSLIEALPNRREFEKAYHSAETYAICVCVPVDEHTDDTVQTIRLFRHATNEEVVF